MPKANATIMITGTHGFVGARALEKYKNAIAVPSELVRNADKGLLDFVRSHHPDIIINTAAISDIRACEKDPEGSLSSNVTLPVTLAEAAKEIGAKLISFSSDQVYTGCPDAGPYREDTTLPPPANLYARHKLEAEERVLAIDPTAVLLRATWMYDMPLYGHANRGNFLANMLTSVMRGETACFSDRTMRGITYVRQVVELLDRVFDLPGGVYNYGSENPLSMYDTAKEFLKALGIEDPDDRLVAKSTDPQYKPHNLWMSCEKLRRHGICFDTTAEGFACCAEDYFLTLGKK